MSCIEAVQSIGSCLHTELDSRRLYRRVAIKVELDKITFMRACLRTALVMLRCCKFLGMRDGNMYRPESRSQQNPNDMTRQSETPS